MFWASSINTGRGAILVGLCWAKCCMIDWGGEATAQRLRDQYLTMLPIDWIEGR